MLYFGELFLFLIILTACYFVLGFLLGVTGVLTKKTPKLLRVGKKLFIFLSIITFFIVYFRSTEYSCSFSESDCLFGVIIGFIYYFPVSIIILTFSGMSGTRIGSRLRI